MKFEAENIMSISFGEIAFILFFALGIVACLETFETIEVTKTEEIPKSNYINNFI